jgi:hypothetical protein
VTTFENFRDPITVVEWSILEKPGHLITRPFEFRPYERDHNSFQITGSEIKWFNYSNQAFNYQTIQIPDTKMSRFWMFLNFKCPVFGFHLYFLCFIIKLKFLPVERMYQEPTLFINIREITINDLKYVKTTHTGLVSLVSMFYEPF